jgi:FO synthase subunit 2
MVRAVGRRPVERSTDYRKRRPIEGDGPHGPELGPRADGTPMLREGGPATAGDTAATDD